MTNPNIIWFASYPKSGNTWLRMFHMALNTAPDEEFLPSNAGEYSNQCCSKGLYQKVMHDRPLRQTEEEAYRMRVPLQQRLSAMNAGRPVYLKTHSVNVPLDGIDVFDHSLTALAIIIVRNPFDILASQFNHYRSAPDDVIKDFDNPKAVFDINSIARFPVLISSWGLNVYSWLGEGTFPKLLLRYEDLHADDGTLWSQLARTVFRVDDEERISRAIELTRFENLKDSEIRHGFKEKPATSERFFNRGEVGYGADVLTDEQKDRIWARNGALAERLGYFYEDGALRVGDMNLGNIHELYPGLASAA